jgi:transposase
MAKPTYQQLLRENRELRAENERLRCENQELRQQVAQLTAQVKTLTEQVARLSKDSSTSSKPPSSDIVKPPKPPSPDGPRRQGGQTGHAGHTRPAFAPDQIDHSEDLHPERCDCGAALDSTPVGPPKTHQVAELVEKPIRVSQYRLHAHRCPRCGKVVWAELPPGVIPDQLFGPRLQALVGYMKGALHASYTSLAAFWADVLGIGVTRSHLCNTVGRVNDALAAPYDELAAHVPTEPVLHVDESGWKDRGVRYWIWVFCTRLVGLFLIAKSRGAGVLRDVLGEVYGGTIVSDFFSAYRKYANRLQQFCLAHLIRDIKFLTTLPDEADQRFGRLLLAQFKRLFRFWHLREKIPKARLDRLLFRIKHRVLRLPAPYAQGERSKSRTLARRLVTHGESIFRFLFDAAVPPTNNTGEQTLRFSVIDRRITQGSRSLLGRQWNARIWTVLATCRKQGRSAWRFLQEAVSAHYFQTPTPSLIPVQAR